MTFWETVGRGLRLRCPRCGEGKLFKGLFAMADACSSCGLDFQREQGYYIGAMYINYGMTTLILLGVSLPLIGKYPLASILWPLYFRNRPRGGLSIPAPITSARVTP